MKNLIKHLSEGNFLIGDRVDDIPMYDHTVASGVIINIDPLYNTIQCRVDNYPRIRTLLLSKYQKNS